jgi:hypothetical protein
MTGPFRLVGASVLIPIILTDTGYSYWAFRGRSGIHRSLIGMAVMSFVSQDPSIRPGRSALG